MSTMLSRSGRSNDGGKLNQRFDIPVSEELNERVIVAAAAKGVPKAEFLRDMIEEALINGCWFPLTPQARKSLEVLAALHDQPPGVYLADLVNAALVERFSMARSVIQNQAVGQPDEYPTEFRRRG